MAETLVRRLDRAGIHAVAALGNTAEVYQLGHGQRSDLLRAAAEGRSGAALVAGMTGGISSVLKQAELAANLGYDAVMLHDPVDPFPFDAGLGIYVHAVADASPLPVVACVRPDFARAL